MLKLEYSILYHTLFHFATGQSNILIKSYNILKHKYLFFMCVPPVSTTTYHRRERKSGTAISEKISEGV